MLNVANYGGPGRMSQRGYRSRPAVYTRTDPNHAVLSGLPLRTRQDPL